MKRTGTMASRIDRSRFSDPYCANEDITHLRVHTSGFGSWFVDGANADGSLHCEPCWEFESFDHAVQNLRAFAEENAPHLLEGA